MKQYNLIIYHRGAWKPYLSPRLEVASGNEHHDRKMWTFKTWMRYIVSHPVYGIFIMNTGECLGRGEDCQKEGAEYGGIKRRSYESYMVWVFLPLEHSFHVSLTYYRNSKRAAHHIACAITGFILNHMSSYSKRGARILCRCQYWSNGRSWVISHLL